VAEDTVPPDVSALEAEEICQRVWRLLSRTSPASSPPAGLTLTFHRRRSDGRAVVEYRFPGSVRAFAKLYPQPAAGRSAFEIYRMLYRKGFGGNSPHRVPEPIAYLEDCGVLLLAPAPGDQLARTDALGCPAFEEGVARAAEWLAALHCSPVRVGRRETVADGAFRLTRRAGRATAARSDLENLVHGLLEELERRSAPAVTSGTSVQTHGRFHPGHVFVASDSVTAVDLDRAAQADPAKDVGQFIHALRSIGARSGVVEDAVERACARFLDEYVRAGGSAPAALEYYWSFSIVWTLLGLALKDRPARPGWKERVQFFLAEFDAVPARAAALSSSGGA
jgi:hypothetical protein